ncbi:WD40 repeat-like protein [Saitoella complicata NRRL Y-17804]|nr:WD40 repeat-like protein [Saitoella complicata NRRL Y-17804]ODQ52271.1 WD40 repeat-like protein [Saitoella complicata NRRL Y-17804]
MSLLKDLPTVTASQSYTSDQSALLASLDLKRRAARVAAPTDDAKVRHMLRNLGEPITLFAEGPAERRDRLKLVLAKKEEEDSDFDMDAEEEEGEGEEQEEFYTPGSEELLSARRKMAEYSLPRAKARLRIESHDAKISLPNHINQRKALRKVLVQTAAMGAQLTGDRPTGIARFSPDGRRFATGDWGGGVKVWRVGDMECESAKYGGHRDRVGGLSWNPDTTSILELATGGGDGELALWSTNNDKPEPLHLLKDIHTHRVNRVAFHPSGQYLASASADTTWSLIDLPTLTPLLHQSGHSRAVYALAPHPDGSLLATGGQDAIGRAWDLRTGRTIMVLDGHVGDVLGLDWAEDGYRVLSAAGDGSVKVWDLRAVRCVATIPAHKGLASDVRWCKGGDITAPPKSQPAAADPDAMDVSQDAEDELPADRPSGRSTWFATSGYDASVNLWSADDWTLVKTLKGHDGKVMSCDVSPGGEHILSSGWERVVRMWGRD